MSMFDARRVVWDGQGTDVTRAVNSKMAMDLAGLGWDVVQKPIYTDTSLVEGFKANVRDYDDKVLGIVTDRYKVVQNREAFAFTDALLGEGVSYETAGSMAGGKKIWLLARLDRCKLGGDNFDPYLVFFNTHDGSGSIRVAITPIRVICQNMLNLALRSASRSISFVHKGDIESKLEEARRTLSHTKEYLGALDEEFGDLQSKSLTDARVKEFVEELLPLNEKEPSQVRRRNIEAMRKDLLYRYFFAPDLVDVNKSAYRFINAVSDFATHTDIHKETKHYHENLFDKTANGNPIIDKAYQLVKAA